MKALWVASATAALIILAPHGAWGGPDLLGAKTVISQVKAAEQAGPSAPDADRSGRKAREALGEQILAFERNRSALSPEAASRQWLALVDGFLALRTSDSTFMHDFYGRDPYQVLAGGADASMISLPLVVSVLPGPESWDALDQAIGIRVDSSAAERKLNAALRILMHLVHGRLDQAGDDIATLGAALREDSRTSHFFAHSDVDRRLNQLKKAVRETIGFNSGAEVVQDYRRLLSQSPEGDGSVRTVQVPDLCRLTTDEADAHYEKAFEQMPEQFGRVASFCFGCEGVLTAQTGSASPPRSIRGQGQIEHWRRLTGGRLHAGRRRRPGGSDWARRYAPWTRWCVGCRAGEPGHPDSGTTS